MRILIINSSVRKGIAYGLDDGMPTGLMDFLGGYQPLGICYIASVLKKNGYKDLRLIDAEAADLSIEEAIEKTIEFSPDVLAISAMTFSFLFALELARRIKEHRPYMPVIIGGPHVDLYPEEVMSHGCFDLAVTGEGEHTFLELIKLLEKNGTASREGMEKLNGVCIRTPGGTRMAQPDYIKDLDSLPFPSRDMLDINDYRQNYLSNPFISLLTTRGCPFNCAFCCKTSWYKHVRAHSPEYVTEEIEYCMKEFNARAFQFFDDNFTTDKKRMSRICALIGQKGLDIEFLAMSRVDLIDEDVIKTLRRAGCKCISLGIESGDQGILDLMNKRTTVEQAKRAVALCRKYGIDSVTYFMLGHPEETHLTVQNTLRFIRDSAPRWFKANILIPYPGSSLLRALIDKKKIPDFWKEMTILGRAISAPHICRNLSRKDLERYRNKINLMPYFRLRTNLLNIGRVFKKPDNVIWTLRWLWACLKNYLKGILRR